MLFKCKNYKEEQTTVEKEEEMNRPDGTFRLCTNVIRQLLFFTHLILNEGVPSNNTMMKDIRVIDMF